MAIREWREGDLESVLALLRELDEALGEDQGIDRDILAGHFRKMNEEPETYGNYVFEEEGRAVGFMSLLFYRSVYHRRGSALINELVVSKDYRNGKIGARLLDHAIREAKARGMDELEVGVMKENEAAIRFYKRRGIAEEYLLLGMELPPPRTISS